jgi:hypothetical protein
MSADNYYRIHRAGGRYFVTCDFASDENWPSTGDILESGRPIHWYDTLEEAQEYAYSEYSEYGVTYAFPGEVGSE